jgi:hypothetical protein
METLTTPQIIIAILIFALCMAGACAIFALIYFFSLKKYEDVEDQELFDTHPYNEEEYR